MLKKVSFGGGTCEIVSGLRWVPYRPFCPCSPGSGRTAPYVAASSRRTRWKLARANRVKRWAVFLARPRYLTLRYPNRCLMIPKGCSTRERTRLLFQLLRQVRAGKAPASVGLAMHPPYNAFFFGPELSPFVRIGLVALVMLPRFRGRYKIWDSGGFLEPPFVVYG